MGEKKRAEKKEEEKERDSTFSLISRRSDRRFQVEQEEEFNLTARASHRDRSWGVLTKTPRGKGFLLLGLILV